MNDEARDPAQVVDEAIATAVRYLRVSSVGQVKKGIDPEGYSIPGQREAAEAKAQQLNAKTLREYVEYGVSGRSTKRPALQQMLSDLQELKPTYVIVYDLSRLARNRLDDAQLMLQIESSGAQLVSVLENIDQTASGRLTHGVLAAVNEFRSAGDAEKIKMGMKRRHAMGGTNGRAPIGYRHVRTRELGREVRSVDLDPVRAPLVGLAFECYATGEYTISTLTEMLDAAGLRTPMTAKLPSRPLGRSAVHRMLRDDYYIGVVTHDGAKNPNGQHPKLIDDETFERVQQLLEAHQLAGNRYRKHEHYLKGSMFCGECGGRLIYTRNRGHGGIYEYFKCYSSYNRSKNCTSPHHRVKQVEEKVEQFYATYHWLTEDEKSNARAAIRRHAHLKIATAQSEIERSKQRLDVLKSEQQQLLQLSYKGLVDDDVLATEQARIKHERAAISKWTEAATRDASEMLEALEEALQLLDDPGRAYALASPNTRRMLNQALFERLEVETGEVRAQAAPWLAALEDVARMPRTRARRPHVAPDGPLKAALDLYEAQKHRGRHIGGQGSNKDQMVPLPGFEPGFPP